MWAQLDAMAARSAQSTAQRKAQGAQASHAPRSAANSARGTADARAQPAAAAVGAPAPLNRPARTAAESAPAGPNDSGSLLGSLEQPAASRPADAAALPQPPQADLDHALQEQQDASSIGSTPPATEAPVRAEVSAPATPSITSPTEVAVQLPSVAQEGPEGPTSHGQRAQRAEQAAQHRKAATQGRIPGAGAAPSVAPAALAESSSVQRASPAAPSASTGAAASAAPARQQRSTPATPAPGRPARQAAAAGAVQQPAAAQTRAAPRHGPVQPAQAAQDPAQPSAGAEIGGFRQAPCRLWGCGVSHAGPVSAAAACWAPRSDTVPWLSVGPEEGACWAANTPCTTRIACAAQTMQIAGPLQAAQLDLCAMPADTGPLNRSPDAQAPAAQAP